MSASLPEVPPAEPKQGVLRALVTDRFLHDVLITAFFYSIVRLLLFPNIPAMGRPLQLPFEAYQGASIVMAALKNPAFVALAGSGLLALFLDQIPGKWNPFFGRVAWDDFPPRTGLIVMGICLPMMWSLSTYDVNLLFDQVHAADRILVFVLWLAMGRNPAFAPIWLAVAAVVAEQFKYPDCMHATWADKALMLYVPLLVWVSFVVSRFRKTSPWLFPALLLCHWASFYVYPAFAKLVLGDTPWTWLLQNGVNDLFVASHLNGWLPNLSDAQVEEMAQTMAKTDIVIQFVTLAIELSPLLILWKRRYAMAVVAACACLHIGIFVTTGICFWEWITVNLVLIWALRGPWSKEPVADMFNARFRLLSGLLIACALPVFWPYPLAWFDTNYNVVYDLELEDAEGTRYQLRREYMDPFHGQHMQSRFFYVDPRPNLPVHTYSAVVDQSLFEALDQVETLEELTALHDQRAVVRFDAVLRDQYVAYIQTYFANLNQRGGHKSVVPGWLQAPHHHKGFGGTWPSEAPWSEITSVRVIATDVFWNGQDLHRLRTDEVLLIEIPAASPPYQTLLEAGD
ncbi:MAG: hypothetical protein ACJAYU_002965 [Bradymonadia bacterium]|jgi:hypothetical protein